LVEAGQGSTKGSMTDVVRRWHTFLATPVKPHYLPLPHPSWRNSGWINANPWFEKDLLPALRREVRRLL
jgi:uracil-DNA glycosylase